MDEVSAHNKGQHQDEKKRQKYSLAKAKITTLEHHSTVRTDLKERLSPWGEIQTPHLTTQPLDNALRDELPKHLALKTNTKYVQEYYETVRKRNPTHKELAQKLNPETRTNGFKSDQNHIKKIKKDQRPDQKAHRP